MKQHMIWAILAVITFAAHMVAGMYADYIWFLPEYVWFASLSVSVVAIYTGSKSAGIAREERRGLAVASALIGAIVLLGLLLSATISLFVSNQMIAALMACLL